MKATSSSARFGLGWLFALLLAARLLAPAGFMPAFDHDRVTIVPCPDADVGQRMAAHHHGDHRAIHQPCPYAAASTAGVLGADWTALAAPSIFAVPLLLGPVLAVALRGTGRDRPPARGPPLPA